MTQPQEDGIFVQFDQGRREAIRQYRNAPLWALEGEVAGANAREADPTWRESADVMYELGRHQGLRELLAAKLASNVSSREWMALLPQDSLGELVTQLCELVVVDPRNVVYQRLLSEASEVWEHKWPGEDLPLLPTWYLGASHPRTIELLLVTA